MTSSTLPPTTELFSNRDLAARHGPLLTIARLKWALRNRARNGLDELHAVYDSKGGELLIWEPKFLAWFLGLTGRHKPRSRKTKSRDRRRPGIASVNDSNTL